MVFLISFQVDLSTTCDTLCAGNDMFHFIEKINNQINI